MVEAALRHEDEAVVQSVDPNTLLFFVHVPKTGGTSFVELLKTVYGRHFLHVKLARRFRVPQQLYTLAAANRLQAIAGHVPFGFHREFGTAYSWLRRSNEHVFAERDIKYISIVRDPVDRVKSFYRYVMATPGHRLHHRVKGQSPREFLRFMAETTKSGAGSSNHQTRLIGMGCKRDIEAIKERVREDFHAVGVLEEIGPFVKHLAKTLHWPGNLEMGHFNRSRHPRDTEDFDAETIEWIRERNRLDHELYEYVRTEGQKYWKS